MRIEEQAKAIGLALMFGQVAVFMKKTVTAQGEFFSVDLLGAEKSPVQFRLSGLINATPESATRECKSGAKQKCVMAGHASFEWPREAAQPTQPTATATATTPVEIGADVPF